VHEKIIVTRHKALVQYMVAKGIVPEDTPVIVHARPGDVRGKIVYGVVPLRLAALAHAVVEVPLRLSEEDRLAEIQYERLCEIAQPPIMYHVEAI
jgi:hypothetical protein